MGNNSSDALTQALAEFVGAFELVFHYDWDYTKIMIGGEEPSFLSPGLDREAESEDWGARGALLEKYRNLKALLRQSGVAPVLPFSLENVRTEPPQEGPLP